MFATTLLPSLLLFISHLLLQYNLSLSSVTSFLLLQLHSSPLASFLPLSSSLPSFSALLLSNLLLQTVAKYLQINGDGAPDGCWRTDRGADALKICSNVNSCNEKSPVKRNTTYLQGCFESSEATSETSAAEHI